MDLKRTLSYPLLTLVAVGLATQGFQSFGSESLLWPLIITAAYFTAIFIYAQILVNNSIVDIGWGMGFVIGAWATLLSTANPSLLSYIIVLFITIWGVRLSYRLFKRNWTKPEDYRYAQWRKEWGSNIVVKSFFRVFVIQGLINFIVGSAAYAVIKYNSVLALGGLEWLIIAVSLSIASVGLFFEVVGDEQLRQHIAKKTGTLLQSGLWSMTRHPNYFGEILIWVGLYLAGFSLVLNHTLSFTFYLALAVSPVVMSSVLIRISTPLLEKNMEKYAEWSEYIKRVPMIFPWTKP
jgi:steroid 5-alpha reductase family enzyme